jgi:prepilin-type N-terminal cleavage/methylation domain-containing protein/prepilin-type processing-associated H-X9-DG protein
MTPHPGAARRPRAFTLIELLAVIAIIGALAALVTGVLGGARARARAATCLSNLRQVGAAAHLFAAENGGRLPGTSHLRTGDGASLSWTATLAPQLGAGFLGRCPDALDHPAKITYGWNDLLTTGEGAGLPLSACRQPSATLMLAELAPEQSAEHFHFAGAARGRVTPALFRSFIHVERHGASANYLFVDGHVAALSWAEIQRRLALAPSPLVHP